MSKNKSFWIPMNVWNLNELFTTESISPISFYEERNFGNPLNRNQIIEDENNLVLFNSPVQSDILLKLSSEMLTKISLSKISKTKKDSLERFQYTKTIYLKKGLFKVYFRSQETFSVFLNSAFMLMEVKTVNKYKDDFIVDAEIFRNNKIPIHQYNTLIEKDKLQPSFDKAFNQIKGLIYGYIIGLIGTLSEKEQDLVSDLVKLINSIAGIHTDIVLTKIYSNSWLGNVKNQIMECKINYNTNLNKPTDIFDMILLRLDEIDNLNKMRCNDLAIQKNPQYRIEFEKGQEKLEQLQRELYNFDKNSEVTSWREELDIIKNEEVKNGKVKGKSREYFSKGTPQYNRKIKLKKLISNYENIPEYQKIISELNQIKKSVREYRFGYTQYDTSISEQFSRISEYLNEILKKTTTFFLNRNNTMDNFPDIRFEFDIKKLATYYFNERKVYTDFITKFPKILVGNLIENDINIIKTSLNAILLQPQGRLGNYSEKIILDIIKIIGKQLVDESYKQILRNYYNYRIGKIDNFIFPENNTLNNLLVFLFKFNDHEQINKMIVKKNIQNKQIAFMLYGAYVGFANMPKTFTNIIFNSNNNELLSYIDNYLFDILLQDEPQSASI